ncbi:MAG: DUF2721 domain-containing protein [Pirellula staleyi]
MQIDFTTPALLFSTISLLLLAYTNRFLGLSKVIREQHAGWGEVGKWIFGGSLLLMAASLGISLVEIRMSVGALDIHLKEMEH